MKEGWPNLAVWVTYRHLAGALCIRRQSWFLPHSLQARHFLHILCTQMDSHFKKEQIDTLFVYVGLLQAGFWGG